MPMIYIAVDNKNNVQTATTTDPKIINYAPNDNNIPVYQYKFELTWEQIEELWKCKIENGELLLREDL